MPIRKCLVSRYHQEFHEVCKLGAGEFGDVFKCINRLDGCTYAIKRSKQAIAGSALEIAAWKEVCAHAVLVRHNHIVQYYSAWAEILALSRAHLSPWEPTWTRDELTRLAYRRRAGRGHTGGPDRGNGRSAGGAALAH